MTDETTGVTNTTNEPRLTRTQYAARLQEAYHIALLVNALPLDGMLEAIDRAETLGPVLDPTLWIRKADDMAKDKRIIEALIEAQRILRGGRSCR